MTDSPLLLVTRSTSENKFSRYLAEILLTEGYTCFNEIDLGTQTLSKEMLNQSAVVLLADLDPTPEEAATFREYVAEGGRLIASRPHHSLVELFAIQEMSGDYYRTARDRYLVINGEHELMAEFPATSLQYHGRGIMWEPDGAEELAYFTAAPDRPTHFPAVVHHHFGKGETFAFLYELAESTVRFHQGRYENSSLGSNAGADDSGMFKAPSLSVDYLDARLKYVPQADLHQDILVRMIRHLTKDTLPIPRVWHFPQPTPAAALIDGDSDGMSEEDLKLLVDTCEKNGVPYTCFMMDAHIQNIPPETITRYVQRGHDFGMHYWAGPTPTCEEMRSHMRELTSSIANTYEYTPVSTRTHSCVWVGWAEHAEYLAENGIRLDTSFCPGRYYQEGYINGSGLPVKLVDGGGQVIDVYEQATVTTDDGVATEKGLLPAMSVEVAIESAKRIVDDCAERYHIVFHPYFHPLAMQNADKFARCKAVLAYLAERGLPAFNARDWVDFNDARRSLEFRKLTFDAAASRFAFELRSPTGMPSATLMIDVGEGDSEVRLDGAEVGAGPRLWEGLRWLVFEAALEAGQWHYVEVRGERREVG